MKERKKIVVREIKGLLSFEHGKSYRQVKFHLHRLAIPGGRFIN